MIFNFYHTRKNALLIPDGVEYWTVSDIEIDQEPSEPEVSIESSTFQTATTDISTLSSTTTGETQSSTVMSTEDSKINVTTTARESHTSTAASILLPTSLPPPTMAESQHNLEAITPTTSAVTQAISSPSTTSTTTTTISARRGTTISMPENTTQITKNTVPESFLSLIAPLLIIFERYH
ncbi:hypothetical protein PRIPAC_91121 [Pristionchus pacificus]|nr:hypothetical protein PRIPAC_91121 [Pristionchus pacificus]